MQSSSLNKNSSQGAQAILNFYRNTEDTISKHMFRMWRAKGENMGKTIMKSGAGVGSK